MLSTRNTKPFTSIDDGERARALAIQAIESASQEELNQDEKARAIKALESFSFYKPDGKPPDDRLDFEF